MYYNNVNNISKCFVTKSIKDIEEDKNKKETFLSNTRNVNSIYDLICIPCRCRTSKEVQKLGEHSYVYQYPTQGASISVFSGILTPGLQINSNIYNDELLKTLKDTSYTLQDGFKVVNPKEFVKSLMNK